MALSIDAGSMTFAPSVVPVSPRGAASTGAASASSSPHAATSTPHASTAQISIARRLDTSSPSYDLCATNYAIVAAWGRARRAPGMGRGCCGRRTGDEPQLQPLRAPWRTLERLEQQPCAAHAALLERLRDGGQPDVAGDLHVVEARPPRGRRARRSRRPRRPRARRAPASPSRRRSRSAGRRPPAAPAASVRACSRPCGPRRTISSRPASLSAAAAPIRRRAEEVNPNGSLLVVADVGDPAVAEAPAGARRRAARPRRRRSRRRTARGCSQSISATGDAGGREALELGVGRAQRHAQQPVQAPAGRELAERRRVLHVEQDDLVAGAGDDARDAAQALDHRRLGEERARARRASTCGRSRARGRRRWARSPAPRSRRARASASPR